MTWLENPQHGGLEGTVNKMREEDPDFVMGKVVALGLDAIGTARSVRLDEEYKKDIDELDALVQKGGRV